MDIRSAARADLDPIIQLHREAFKGLFGGDLSVPCLLAFYQSLLDNPRCATYLVYEGNRLAGFITGGLSADYATFGIKIRMIGEVFKMFRFLEIPRLIKKAVYYKRFGTMPELISIVVHPEFQRRGIGLGLLRALENFFMTHAITRYFVYTDLKHSHGLEFYKANRFEELKRVDLFGLEGVFLQKHIHA